MFFPFDYSLPLKARGAKCSLQAKNFFLVLFNGSVELLVTLFKLLVAWLSLSFLTIAEKWQCRRQTAFHLPPINQEQSGLFCSNQKENKLVSKTLPPGWVIPIQVQESCTLARWGSKHPHLFPFKIFNRRQKWQWGRGAGDQARLEKTTSSLHWQWALVLT